jgi:hypothetical protein
MGITSGFCIADDSGDVHARNAVEAIKKAAQGGRYNHRPAIAEQG